ncbi:putative N-ethylmaleimide reductase [Periconia macrospinosa]|uniref:Putative N-ethylmaleimide reductase n=1 Tax=Periconia macrospinosa TaxID=97972 RepID=A0A2V1DY14_9PLEO|nr:putative N-ethylmaleimide reductase [Periconia macrospinosa]
MDPSNLSDSTEIGGSFVTNSVKSQAPASAEQFQFISIQNLGEAKGRQNQRRLRSHAVKQALRTKKALKEKEAQDAAISAAIYAENPGRAHIATNKTETLTVPSVSAPSQLLDPSLIFGVTSPRLRQLLLPISAKYAAEPVFSLSEGILFQTYRSVFRVGLTEPALLNAVKLTLVYATQGLSTSREALEYKDKAITSLRSTLGALDMSILESTMGAILLLADLSAALLTGSRRIVDHNTFVELRWTRDSWDSTFELGLGFQRVRHLLDVALVVILEDLHSLQWKRDSATFSCGDAVDLIHVDNQQASIQSRIYNRLLDASLSPLLRCFYTAAYLGATVLCCKVWVVSVIPPFVSRLLLHNLLALADDPIWSRHPDLLLWLLTLGASFSSEGNIRSEYVSLLHAQSAKGWDRAYSFWPQVQQVLKQFIWSDKAIADKEGRIEAQHRIGMPALTRFRAQDGHIPGQLMCEYYSQRATVPGTFIITESSLVSRTHDAMSPHSPMILTKAQTAGWKAVVEEVHARRCPIFCQLIAVGRVSDPELARRDGLQIVAPSAIPWNKDSAPIPVAMSAVQVADVIQSFVISARNAIDAGFDGVEIHGANGYLVDQFLQEGSNQRTDGYGGSITNRSRFAVQLLEAVGDAIGFDRLALRLSPWSTFQGMGMGKEATIAQFSDVISRAQDLNIAYLHLVESRVTGNEDTGGSESLDFAINLWKGSVLVAGGHTPESARTLVDETFPGRDIMVTFGRLFVANPDLVFRIREGIKLNRYKREYFYAGGSRGYLDYPFSESFPAH